MRIYLHTHTLVFSQSFGVVCGIVMAVGAIAAHLDLAMKGVCLVPSLYVPLFAFAFTRD